MVESSAINHFLQHTQVFFPYVKYFSFRSGKMYVLDSNTKELISTLKMNGSVDDIAFMNDGRDMLSFGDEGIVHVWDMNSRQCVHTFVDEVSSLLFLLYSFLFVDAFAFDAYFSLRSHLCKHTSSC